MIMNIPDYQTLMLPLLQTVGDGKEYKTRELIDVLSDKFQLTQEERRDLLPSGTQPIIDNRVGWARTYLAKAGLLTAPKRGYVQITQAGTDVLEDKPSKIDVKFLEQFDTFVEFRSIKKDTFSKQIKEVETEEMTPDELIERGYNSINTKLAQELLEKLRKIDPYLFEKVVGELLFAMGYGRFEATPYSGDKGIDGIVHQDKLGLERIFFQAKRYAESNIVNARDVRDFVGTLDLHGVNKGLFITTSRFPNDTALILQKTPKNIILVDGSKLAKLMIEHDVGVNTKKAYKIKDIDVDFFADE